MLRLNLGFHQKTKMFLSSKAFLFNALLLHRSTEYKVNNTAKIIWLLSLNRDTIRIHLVVYDFIKQNQKYCKIFFN